MKIIDSPIGSVETVLSEGYTALFSNAEIETMRLEADLPKEMEAPVEAGEILGKAILWLGDEKITEIDLIAQNSAPSYTLAERLRRLAENWLSWRKF